MMPPKGTYLFFAGIGGAGMSALAGWLHAQGYAVAGYDRTPNPLCLSLETAGISIAYDSNPEDWPAAWNTPSAWCIYTPALQEDNPILAHFRNMGCLMKKRAALLAECLAPFKTMAVAGTHGKTTTSCMMAWLMQQSTQNASAILGGVSANFQNNYLLQPNASFAVTEADEFDRSFLLLNPFISVLTSMDPDHLDVYGQPEALGQAFGQFASQTQPDGCLIARTGLKLPPMPAKIKRYGIETGYYAATKLRSEDGCMQFDLEIDGKKTERFALPMLGAHNVENATAALAACIEAGASPKLLAKALREFKGVARRMHLRFQNHRMVYIDDYAHHPKEIEAVLLAVRAAFPDRFVTGIFQPHLFTRTKDFATGFREVLGQLDALWLMEIYPAREKPITGIHSNWLLEEIQMAHKSLLLPENLQEVLQHQLVEPGVLLTLGAGDIDRLAAPIETWLNQNRT